MRMYSDLRRPDRRTPKRVLVAKSFDFVHTVWSMYVQRNQTDLKLGGCVSMHGANKQYGQQFSPCNWGGGGGSEAPPSDISGHDSADEWKPTMSSLDSDNYLVINSLFGFLCCGRSMCLTGGRTCVTGFSFCCLGSTRLLPFTHPAVAGASSSHVRETWTSWGTLASTIAAKSPGSWLLELTCICCVWNVLYMYAKLYWMLS